MKVKVKEKWLYGDKWYGKGDTVEMSKERFNVLVSDGVKLEEVKEIKKEKNDL